MKIFLKLLNLETKDDNSSFVHLMQLKLLYDITVC